MNVAENIALVAQKITGADISPVAERDLRADGARRVLSCDNRRVSISRKLQGISMKIEVPANSYFGIVLSIFAGEDGEPFYRISMPHSDPDFAICLYESRNDEDIVAVWKAWAKFFSLPKLLERTAGELECGEAMMGGVQVGARQKWRRRGASLGKRRSRMSMRRRAGDRTRMGAVSSHEDEIIARN